jgi:hypothetical protein
LIFSGVPAEQEAAVLQHVGQGERLGRSGPVTGHDPFRARASQQRADGQAQLVQQAVRGELSEQARAALGQYPPVAPFGQRGDGRLEIDGLLAGHDDVGQPLQRGPPVRRGLGGGDDDRAGRRRGRGDEPAGRVEVQPPADHRDGRGGRPARPQVRPELVPADRRVALGPDRPRAHHDHVGQRAEQCEQVPVGL